MNRYTFRNATSQQRLARLEQLFATGPQTMKSAALSLHIAEQHIKHYIKHLHDQGLIYISAWPRAGGDRGLPYPQYARGNRPDAPRPAVKTASEIERAYRKRRDADADKRRAYLAKRQADNIVRNPRRDISVTALFGKAA